MLTVLGGAFRIASRLDDWPDAERLRARRAEWPRFQTPDTAATNPRTGLRPGEAWPRR
ncbi:MAG: hypothetical protein Kow0013_08830 [Pararhodobacter sp.]